MINGNVEKNAFIEPHDRRMLDIMRHEYENSSAHTAPWMNVHLPFPHISAACGSVVVALEAKDARNSPAH